MWFLCFLLVVTSQDHGPTKPTPPHPMVVVPGFSASSLFFSRNNVSIPGPSVCPENSDWGKLWPIPHSLETNISAITCLIQAFRVNFDVKTSQFSNYPGIDIDILGFGGFAGMGNRLNFIDGLKGLGYTEGENLFGAPYDWRFGGPGIAQTGFFDRLKILVEEASASNDGKKVCLWATSYAPQVALGFLHRQTQEWKDKYIAKFLAVSPVWSGTQTALGATVFGAFNDTAEAKAIRSLAVQADSMLWLWPRMGEAGDNSTWDNKEVLVSTPSKNYTAYDGQQLLKDMGIDYKLDTLKYLQNDADLKDFKAPGVDTFVTYGSELPTTGGYVFDKDFKREKIFIPPLPSAFILDPDGGDSLVPARSSLRGKNAWTATHEAMGKELIYKAYPQQYHADCIQPYTQCWSDVTRWVMNWD